MDTLSGLLKAIDFACFKHKEQLRKGGQTPYVMHPLNVGRILLEAGADLEYAIAGILHDTLEDTNTNQQEIITTFGQHIFDLVYAASEKNRSDSWEQRKNDTILELSSCRVEYLYVPCADKLDNMITLKNQLRTQGESFWRYFGTPYEEQKWYYTTLADLFNYRLKNTMCYPLASDLQHIVGDIFV